MKITDRAQIKHPDRPETEKVLALFQVESKVFRWIDERAGEPFDKIDYLRREDAIKGLRVLIEGSPDYVGFDLTLLPVELPPDERAAKRIVMEMYCDYVPTDSIAFDVERAANIIDEETQITKLIEAVNLLLTFEIPRLRWPKQAGLDMAHGGLILGVLEALEQAMKVDLGNLKSKLAEGIETVKVYSNMPASGSGKVN